MNGEHGTVIRVDFGPAAPTMDENHPAVMAAARRAGTDPRTWLDNRRRRGRAPGDSSVLEARSPTQSPAVCTDHTEAAVV